MNKTVALFTTRARADRRRRLRRRAVVTAALLSPVAVASVVHLSPLLDVHEVRVLGVHRLSIDAVRQAAGVHRGDEMVRLDIEAMQSRVAALPTVKTAQVHRRWPSRVDIVIVERLPALAVASPTGVRVFDADGVELGQVRTAPVGTPLLSAPQGLPDEKVLRTAVFLMRYLPAAVRARIRALSATTAEDLTLVLDDGARVVWGSAARSEEKLRALLALLPRKARTYDLRAPAHPAIR